MSDWRIVFGIWFALVVALLLVWPVRRWENE